MIIVFVLARVRCFCNDSRKVPVIGITSLGIDHVSLLGSTIETIAWNKAGIMKEGCKAFTVPQPGAAMSVLKKRSIEKKVVFSICVNKFKQSRF
jgi:folylpolyglutamate synthase/dihydropteroate synthase